MTNVNVSLDAIRKRAEAALSCTTPEDFTNEAFSILEEDMPALLSLVAQQRAEVERLQDELDKRKYSTLAEAIEDAFGEQIEVNAKNYADIIRRKLGGDSE
ncbi:hypothetical protein HYI36_20300 [Bacillus sp. Gen3]|nr:hypothetical protein [Bacillus sp. Gen3]